LRSLIEVLFHLHYSCRCCGWQVPEPGFDDTWAVAVDVSGATTTLTVVRPRLHPTHAMGLSAVTVVFATGPCSPEDPLGPHSDRGVRASAPHLGSQSSAS
jgi:hypothetical protein